MKIKVRKLFLTQYGLVWPLCLLKQMGANLNRSVERLRPPTDLNTKWFVKDIFEKCFLLEFQLKIWFVNTFFLSLEQFKLEKDHEYMWSS